ncbi:MAG: cadherin repeat domain-containing protein [Candidatus Poribacteria bacterium]|nr:cadherin repeat domain-containing protein [Candidatus Poribacteria bacterium]
MKRLRCIWIFLFCFITIILAGCGSDVTVNGNLAPIISVFETDSEIVPPGTQVSIKLQANDLENDILTYTWYASDGEINGDATGAIWNAPETEQKYHIKVTVSDGEKSTTSTIDIQVWRIRPGNYYPLAVGNTWRYRDAENTIITFKIIDTIQIQMQDGETVESFVLEKTNSAEELENIADYSYLGYSYDEEGNVTGVLQHATNITPGSEDTVMFVPFLPLYKFPLITGWQWQVRFEAQLVSELFPLDGGLDEFEVLTEETVTVPAGTFENVFQIQESFHWIYELNGPDFTLDTTITQKWLAPNIGIIKFTQSQTRGDVTVEAEFELESYELINN